MINLTPVIKRLNWRVGALAAVGFSMVRFIAGSFLSSITYGIVAALAGGLMGYFWAANEPNVLGSSGHHYKRGVDVGLIFWVIANLVLLAGQREWVTLFVYILAGVGISIFTAKEK